MSSVDNEDTSYVSSMKASNYPSCPMCQNLLICVSDGQEHVVQCSICRIVWGSLGEFTKVLT